MYYYQSVISYRKKIIVRRGALGGNRIENLVNLHQINSVIKKLDSSTIPTTKKRHVEGIASLKALLFHR